jgi:hypothetical protein
MKTKIVTFAVLLSLQFVFCSAGPVPVNTLNTQGVLLHPQQDYPFFNAYRMGRDVSVNWMFNNPILVVFFHVERSVDGVNFTPIAEITPTSNFFFRYRDKTVTQGTFYYRIVAYQHDGAVLTSRTDVIHIGRRC